MDIFLGRLTQEFAANIAAKLLVHRLAVPATATAAVIRSTVPWEGKHTKSDQGLTVEVRGCETEPVLDVTA